MINSLKLPLNLTKICKRGIILNNKKKPTNKINSQFNQLLLNSK